MKSRGDRPQCCLPEISVFPCVDSVDAERLCVFEGEDRKKHGQPCPHEYASMKLADPLACSILKICFYYFSLCVCVFVGGYMLVYAGVH